MTREEIIIKANNALADEFEKEIETFSPDANLQETLEIDSLDLVDLVVLIEKELGIKTAKDDFANVKTFDDFYDLLYSKQR
ncbi:MAG: phosphopantetheine-binding protein [Paludibacteraceae bacterium]|nr:acyl carrier protein [Candidatus Physcocola equi]MCQ2233231.1 phosphopantetheine-binding protein [Paludibacteraceae bacterium]